MSRVQAAVLCEGGARSSTPFVIFQQQRKSKGYCRMKRNTMAQWMNLHQSNSFVNQMQLPLLCEKSGAILLVLVGLISVRQAGPDKTLVKFEILKILYRSHC